MPSLNNLAIKSLTETLQREVKPEKIYDLIQRMNADLNAVYNAVFDGPLPAVDGFALTRLNAASLEGEIPESFNIAYKDEINTFWFGQEIVQFDDEVPFWKLGFGDLLSDPVVDPTSYFRIGSITDGEFFISQNVFYDGAAFDRDDSGIGALKLDFLDGDLAFTWWDSVLGDFRSTWSFSGRELFCGNFDDDDVISAILVDDDDVVRLGESAQTDTTSVGWPAIPTKINTQLPAAAASSDGVIGIDKTNNRFVFYHSGNRYYVTGTSF